MLTRILITLSALLCPGATLAGQGDAPTSLGPAGSPYFVRFDGGLAELHSSGDWGPQLGLRFGRYVERSRSLAVVLSLSGAVADPGYGALQLGLDLRLPVHPSIRPALSGRGGIMVEGEFIGDVLEGSAGLAVRVGTERWIRLEAQVGRHGGSPGPRGFLVGYEQPL